MLAEVLHYLRNYFEKTKYFGDFAITDGELRSSDGTTLKLALGQFYRVIGSVFNDGVHECGNSDLQDETFTGAVWALAVPPAVSALADEISAWTAANSDAINSPYQSESFGGYSYSLKSGGSTGSVTWQSQFAARLAPWRKI